MASPTRMRTRTHKANKVSHNFRLNLMEIRFYVSQDTVNNVYKFQQHRCGNLSKPLKTIKCGILKHNNG